MIPAHQPTIFGKSVVAAVSSVSDGNMKLGMQADDTEVINNRRRFLEHVGIDIAHSSLVALTYTTDDFAKYRIVNEVDKADGMEGISQRHADALLTTTPGHALFLPIADCVGMILYDKEQKFLMVSHVGRHSAEIKGAAKSIEFMKEHGANAEHVKAWLSPAVGKATYPLRAFEGKSLHEVIEEQLCYAGVKPEHIEVSDVDTASDENYFSHSQFLKGRENYPGRFAIVAMMR